MLKMIDIDAARSLLGSAGIPPYTLGVLEQTAFGDLVTCNECSLYDRCPMRRGGGIESRYGFCWQGRRDGDGD